MCVCVCVCEREREGEREGEKRTDDIFLSRFTFPSVRERGAKVKVPSVENPAIKCYIFSLTPEAGQNISSMLCILLGSLCF